MSNLRPYHQKAASGKPSLSSRACRKLVWIPDPILVRRGLTNNPALTCLEHRNTAMNTD